MRQLLPEPGDVDPSDVYGGPRPRPPGRPWMTALMVASADGAATVDGRSGGLGGAGDRIVFRAVRGRPDAIVVGAGTVRAEDYRPVRVPDEVASARRARGLQAHPRLVVVSGRLDLAPTARLLADDDGRAPPPLVLHPPTAPASARRRLEGAVELAEVASGADGRIAPGALVTELDRRGIGRAVVEGGPSLNAELLTADLLDELCLTVDPTVVGGDAPRIAQGPGPPSPRRWTTAHLLTDGHALFWRLLRARVEEEPAPGDGFRSPPTIPPAHPW